MQQLNDFFNVVQQRVNACMQEKLAQMPSEPASLKEAMHYALLLGGKRARPYLVYATGQAYGASLKDLDYVAAAIECIHSYSLIHDDMPEMDNDTLRRGQPTVHAKFGPATALLAGDTLQALAFDFLTDERCHIADEVKARLCGTLARAAGFTGMCGGQALDLLAEHQHLAQDALEHLHALKTGALITAAVQMGYMAARYEDAHNNSTGDVIGLTLGFVERPQVSRDLEHLTTYGKKVGLAFQVWDDVLDVEGDTAVLGKTVGSDEAHEKSTYVSLLGLEGAKVYAQKLSAEAQAALKELKVPMPLLEQFAQFCVSRDH